MCLRCAFRSRARQRLERKTHLKHIAGRSRIHLKHIFNTLSGSTSETHLRYALRCRSQDYLQHVSNTFWISQILAHPQGRSLTIQRPPRRPELSGKPLAGRQMSVRSSRSPGGAQEGTGRSQKQRFVYRFFSEGFWIAPSGS